MENRLLLAFVLSLGVFVVWGWVMAQFQPPPEPQAKKSEKTQQQKIQPSQTGTQTPDAVQPPADTQESGAMEMPFGQDTEAFPDTGTTTQTSSQPGETVEVKTELVTYRFSTKGGVLTHALLHKNKNPEGEPLNLVRHPEGSLYPLTVITGEPQLDPILLNGHFEPSQKSLTLTKDKPQGEITLHLKHESGLEVVRHLTFEYGKPLFKVRTQMRAPPFADKNIKYAVIWGPGIGGADTAGPNYISFSGPTTFVNNNRVENPADDMTNTVTHKGDLVWTSFQNKYFAAALVPEKGVQSAFVQKVDDTTQYVGLNFETVQAASSATYQVYVGTKELELLESLGHKLVRLIDYGWFGNKFAFLVKPILKCLNFFYDLLGNYGWSIILLTFVIKLLFFPLTHKSFKSMKGMQKIQPYVKVLQERYKDDRQKMNEEMIGLYRKHKVNPLGGCLPMLLQIPVFIALYHALFFSIELRGAPFILWIHDLSQSDPYFVTPVLMGATMYLQQKLTPTVADPVQQKIFLMMPLLFTFLFITFPAGLVVYWTVNNLLTISQQYYIYHVAKD